MIKTRLLISFTFLGLALAGSALADNNKVGFVNSQKILNEAPQATRAKKKIEKDFEKRDQDLQKLAKRKQREFREDLSQRQNEETAAIFERVNKVIRQIAEAEKYDIIFQEAVYANPRIDITDKVLKALGDGK